MILKNTFASAFAAFATVLAGVFAAHAQDAEAPEDGGSAAAEAAPARGEGQGPYREYRPAKEFFIGQIRCKQAEGTVAFRTGGGECR